MCHGCVSCGEAGFKVRFDSFWKEERGGSCRSIKCYKEIGRLPTHWRKFHNCAQNDCNLIHSDPPCEVGQQRHSRAARATGLQSAVKPTTVKSTYVADVLLDRVADVDEPAGVLGDVAKVLHKSTKTLHKMSRLK